MSFANVPSEVVAAKARMVIDKIESHRKKKDAESLSRAMAPRTFLWFALPARTEEQAKRHMRDYMWDFPCCDYGYDLRDARCLLALAELGDPVALSCEHARMFHCWETS